MSVSSKVFATTPGLPVITPTGILKGKVLIVSRSGKVHKKVAGTVDFVEGGLQWTWLVGKIRFPSDQLFEEGEKVHVLYKL